MIDGRTDRAREVHAALVLTGGALYLGIEAFNTQLAPATCRWCTPLGIDVSAYDHLAWDHPHAASVASTVLGYAALPVAMFALVALDGDDRSWRRIYDDLTPILESTTAVGLLQHLAKYTVARQRPYVHFGTAAVGPTSHEDNLSFFSGHAALDFALVTSATVVAHKRHSALTPWILAGGLAAAAATGYLRVAAGAHYLTDVLAGAAVGTGVGVVVPLLASADVWGAIVVPTVVDGGGGGISLVGAF